MTSILLRPTRAHLAAYDAALARGWSPDNLGPDRGAEQRARIADDPDGVLAGFDDPTARAGPVILPDGTRVARLPSIRRFIWDDTFRGIISLRWTEDGAPLPPTCLGHIGYAVVPWARNRGFATRALRDMVALAPFYGLRCVEVTAAVDNPASARVIEKAGGRIVETFQPAPELRAGPTQRWRFVTCGGQPGQRL